MKIKIAYNKYLDPIFIAYVKTHEKWPIWAEKGIPDIETVKSRIEAYNTIWREWGEKIVAEMQDITGLSFTNDIDVHIVSVNPRQFATPVVMKSGFSPEEFVSELTHEIFHVLTPKGNPVLNATWRHVKDKYPNDNDNIVVHYILYSVLNEIWKRIGKGFSFDPEIVSDVNKEYARAKEMALTDGQVVIDFLAKV